MSRRCGVDAVGGPVLRRRRAGPLIEDRLQRHERRARVRRDAGGGRATLVEFGEPAGVRRRGSGAWLPLTPRLWNGSPPSPPSPPPLAGRAASTAEATSSG